MFPSTNCATESSIYNFESEENAPKWKNLLTNSLHKVLIQVHPTLVAREDALEYMESLMLRLLGMLYAEPLPHTVADVEDRVCRIVPNPIDKWAMGDAQAAIDKGKKKNSLVLPVDRVHSQLRDTFQTKLDNQVTLYVVAVLEYISADILKLVGNYVKNIKVIEITQEDIRVAMCADKVLMDMFHQVDVDEFGPLVEEPLFLDATFSYDDIVKELIIEEKAYIRELQMIIKVFKDKLHQIPFLRDPINKRNLDNIFSNVTEIYDFSVTLLGSLEDTLEVTKEDELPPIGTCFEELAEGAEFDVYDKYSTDILKPDCLGSLHRIVNCPDVGNALTTAGHGFREAVKYYLPRLLLIPIIHAFSYFKYIELLLSVSTDDETTESLEQVKGLLWKLQMQLDNAIQTSPFNAYLKRKLTEVTSKPGKVSRQCNLHKLSEIQKCFDGWEGKDIAQCCSEFILEGDLKFGLPGKKQSSDRHVFLFDGLIVLCKLKFNEFKYKYKEKFLMRRVEIVDREDTEEIRNSFEIRPRDHPPVILSAKTLDDKNNWMAALVMLNTRSMLERILDSILLEEEKQHPLMLPDPQDYPFSERDFEENIILEERENSGTPLIRGATLPKLVERLTYHMYADPMFVRTFLTTYRSFCTPSELLALLMQRFEIPDPVLPDINDNDSPEMESHLSSIQRESLKRFRKEYSQPVQFRVLNVLRHWVDYHFYDFESDKYLLENLTSFLENIKGKSMKKWVESITKIMQRKLTEVPREIKFSHNRSPPSPKIHLQMNDQDWELALLVNQEEPPDLVRPLLMLHPIEIARQLTLIDFDYYRAVKPSELVGTPWTKEDKEKRSPNLLRMIYHTNNVNNWLQKCVVECENFEERVSVLHRIVEIFIMLYDLNNFSGVFQVSGALDSAAVHRLELTKSEVRRRLDSTQLKIYEEALELGKNHYKKYLEKLRSINPPCVPFFGMYLTNILHIEEGNPDFLPRASKGLINFSKRRKVAEITGEIQQYQNQPYCLDSDPKIRNFLENLHPFSGYTDHEISNYLYQRSKEIEVKNSKKPINKERKWPSIPLKSPGIKPRNPRSVPNIINIMSSGSKPSEGLTEGDDTPHHLTPPTPSTPSTPPASQSVEKHYNPDTAIFAPVEIGPGSMISRIDNRGSIGSVSNQSLAFSIGMTASVPPTPVATNPPLPPHPHTPSAGTVVPPPLPPRTGPRKREPSTGDTSPKVKQAPNAPMLPPRDADPPPIPPRGATSTLPRKHSTSGISGGAPAPPPHIYGTPSSIQLSPFSYASSHLHHGTGSLISLPFSSSLFSSKPMPPPPPPVQQHSPHPLPMTPFRGAPPHLQYRLDPPPQRRRTSSVDLSSPKPQSSNSHHGGDPRSGEESPPPPPPPRLRQQQPPHYPHPPPPPAPTAFSYDPHFLGRQDRPS